MEVSSWLAPCSESHPMLPLDIVFTYAAGMFRFRHQTEDYKKGLRPKGNVISPKVSRSLRDPGKSATMQTALTRLAKTLTCGSPSHYRTQQTTLALRSYCATQLHHGKQAVSIILSSGHTRPDYMLNPLVNQHLQRGLIQQFHSLLFSHIVPLRTPSPQNSMHSF